MLYGCKYKKLDLALRYLRLKSYFNHEDMFEKYNDIDKSNIKSLEEVIDDFDETLFSEFLKSCSKQITNTICKSSVKFKDIIFTIRFIEEEEYFCLEIFTNEPEK